MIYFLSYETRMIVEDNMAENLTVEEIKEIRGMYGLTQKSFAQLLGIGSASMVRYEQGAVPSKANANLIRAARHPEFMRECLERDGELIPQRQREEATRCVYVFVSLEPEEQEKLEGLDGSKRSGTRSFSKKESGDEIMANTMDDVYHYTIQQEVLNEQAANLIGEMISIKVSKGFSGLASDVFDRLLDQVAEMKPSIVSSSAMDDRVLAKYGGYLNCAGDLLKRYQLGAR